MPEKRGRWYSQISVNNGEESRHYSFINNEFSFLGTFFMVLQAKSLESPGTMRMKIESKDLFLLIFNDFRSVC